MSQQLSTSFSDFILALSAVSSFFYLQNSSFDFQYGKWWFMLQIIAASLGVAKFGRFAPIEKYHEVITKSHAKFSWTSMAIGIPCLAAQFCINHEAVLLSQIFIMAAVVNFVGGSKRVELKDLLPMATSAIMFIYLFFIALRDTNFYLGCTVALFILSVLIGDKGVTVFGLPRVDLFHYVLVVTNIFTVLALTEKM